MSDGCVNEGRVRRLLALALLAILNLGGLALGQGEETEFGYVEGSIVGFDRDAGDADAALVRLRHGLVVPADLGYPIEEGPQQGMPGFNVGDRVELYYSVDLNGQRRYAVSDWVRRPALLLLAALFLVVSVAVARFKGLRAFLATGASLAIVIAFIIPMIVGGHSPVFVSLVGVGGILILAIYFVHGVSWSTSAALAGTFVATIVTMILGLLFTGLANLTGFGTEEGMMISFAAGQIDLKGLLLAGLLIGALGALTDITIVQASIVRELAHVNPSFGLADLFKHGMNVGLDHIGSLVNTLVLAYTGSALPLLVLLYVNDIKLQRTLNLELVAAEVVHTLVGSIGLVFAVPLTTFIAALLFRGDRLPLKEGELEHSHQH